MLSFASGIMPKYIRRNKQCLIPHNQQALHDTVTTSAPGRKRLQSCHMFSEQAKQLTGDAQRKTNRTWVKGTWKIRWHTTHCILAEFIHSPSSTDICHDITRHSIVRLDRVRTCYGRFKYNMNLMGLSPSASCTLLESVLYTVTGGPGYIEHDRTQRLRDMHVPYRKTLNQTQEEDEGEDEEEEKEEEKGEDTNKLK